MTTVKERTFNGVKIQLPKGMEFGFPVNYFYEQNLLFALGEEEKTYDGFPKYWGCVWAKEKTAYIRISMVFEKDLIYFYGHYFKTENDTEFFKRSSLSPNGKYQKYIQILSKLMKREHNITEIKR